ncbi:MAG: hypothetical protein E6K80_10165 [Candidatus Eisenbacteria bacterium]|uniref:Uncharacterized protein n=1 Tax=Eiseniibacteriota bacterium TaxID=2212470 RepID=A0A538U209_UNCEI|nr:MAG: hypothetical protein E6K80_10165 [Candidatus Eisenbacteria bacterium]
MSGESTRSSAASAAAFERAFGDRARCNRCDASVADYRVLAVFLHDMVAVRAYCPECYTHAVEGEYHARGDGLILDYPGFAARFGAAGPAPPPCTPVDRALRTLIREPALRSIAPPSEALARRARQTPYRFQLEMEEGAATLALMPDGAVSALDGAPRACARVRELLG